MKPTKKEIKEAIDNAPTITILVNSQPRHAKILGLRITTEDGTEDVTTFWCPETYELLQPSSTPTMPQAPEAPEAPEEEWETVGANLEAEFVSPQKENTNDE